MITCSVDGFSPQWLAGYGGGHGLNGFGDSCGVSFCTHGSVDRRGRKQASCVEEDGSSSSGHYGTVFRPSQSEEAGPNFLTLWCQGFLGGVQLVVVCEGRGSERRRAQEPPKNLVLFDSVSQSQVPTTIPVAGSRTGFPRINSCNLFWGGRTKFGGFSSNSSWRAGSERQQGVPHLRNQKHQVRDTLVGRSDTNSIAGISEQGMTVAFVPRATPYSSCQSGRGDSGTCSIQGRLSCTQSSEVPSSLSPSQSQRV